MISLACLACSWQGEDADLAACPACGGVLDPRYSDSDPALDPARPGIFRYASRLPLRDPAAAVSLGEGQTPLIDSARSGPAMGLSGLQFKLEGLNPSGSYKDRIAAVGISRLRELGKSAWAATSSGNAGAAIAAYGARAGLAGYLFTLEHASAAKIAQIRAHGPRVFAVRGLGQRPEVETRTWQHIAAICAARGWGMLVTARRYSPHAMEGVKTIAYEILEQAGAAPEVVYVPVGGGGLLSATWKGFVEATPPGQRLPQMVAVQPAGCDGVARAWRVGRAIQPIEQCASAISGLQLTAPPDGDLVLRALAESRGWATSVADDQTYAAQSELAEEEGLFVEPAAAITLAALRADLAAGRINPATRVVCLLTGAGFKDGAALQRMAERYPMRLIDADEIPGIEH